MQGYARPGLGAGQFFSLTLIIFNTFKELSQIEPYREVTKKCIFDKFGN